MWGYCQLRHSHPRQPITLSSQNPTSCKTTFLHNKYIWRARYLFKQIFTNILTNVESGLQLLETSEKFIGEKTWAIKKVLSFMLWKLLGFLVHSMTSWLSYHDMIIWPCYNMMRMTMNLVSDDCDPPCTPWLPDCHTRGARDPVDGDPALIPPLTSSFRSNSQLREATYKQAQNLPWHFIHLSLDFNQDYIASFCGQFFFRQPQ